MTQLYPAQKNAIWIGSIGLLLLLVSCSEEPSSDKAQPDAGIEAELEEAPGGAPRDIVLIEGVASTVAEEQIVEEPIMSSSAIKEVIGVGSAQGGAFGSRGRRGGLARREIPPASAAPSEVSAGGLLGRDAQGQAIGLFPLEHTEVEAEIAGDLAGTVVRQTFGNPFSEPIEGVYVFPLPTDAAVNDFVMQIGSRRIVGLIRPREEAAKIYAAARAAGKTTSLLTQERPNIFTQSVANIAPGESVEVSITYFGRLEYDYRTGELEYRFPMVVGPRYVPGKTSAGIDTERVGPAGGRPDAATDRVPDGDRLSPPILAKGIRSDHEVSLAVMIDTGFPVETIESPTHEIDVEHLAPTRARVTLTGQERRLDRDFVLRYRTTGAAPELGLTAHRTESGGYFHLMMVPPVEPEDTAIASRDITFVLDSSGSMNGLPIELCKDIVRRALRSLRAEDRFNVLYFASGSGRLSPHPLPNRAEDIERGLRFLEELEGSGGTEMLRGVEEYLATERDPERVRIVCILTDGYIGNGTEILRTIRDHGQDSRWFAFGVGSSVNRHLVEGVAREGRGSSLVVLPRDLAAGEKASHDFLAKIDAPVLTDIELDWGDLPIEDPIPTQLPDLFTGEPIRIVGRYSSAATGMLLVEARSVGRPVSLTIPVELPEHEPRHSMLPAVWARERIAAISTELISRPGNDEVIEQIRSLALEYRLMSDYTAFVAVDESRTVGTGSPVRVVQPVELPEGMSDENR